MLNQGACEHIEIYITCNKKNPADFKWFGENDRKSNGLKMLDFDLFWKTIEKRRGGGGYKNCVHTRKLRTLNVFFLLLQSFSNAFWGLI